MLEMFGGVMMALICVLIGWCLGQATPKKKED